MRSHYRNIEETASMLSQGDNQGALDMISQTLTTLPDEQNALAKVIAGNTFVPEEYNGYLGQLQDLNQFQNLAMKYKMLSENELDVSETADEIKNAFGKKIVGGASEIYTTPGTYSPQYDNISDEDKKRTKNYQKHTILMPAATTNLTNGLQHFKNAKEDPNAKVLWNRSEVKNPELNNILKSVNVEENDPGIVYNTKSKMSQEIAKSNTIQKFFKENKGAIKNGNLKTGSVEFNYRNGYNRK